jgi:hypothetical protein
VHVDLHESETGPFGKVDELTLPGWMFADTPEDDEGEVTERFKDGFQFAFAGQTFNYDCLGVSKVEDSVK